MILMVNMQQILVLAKDWDNLFLLSDLICFPRNFYRCSFQRQSLLKGVTVLHVGIISENINYLYKLTQTT